MLEVGAGIGANTETLSSLGFRSWVCLEPDPSLAAQIPLGGAAPPEVIVGATGDLPPGRTFDTILYLDVLEHIEDDRNELARAERLLRPGGALIVLAPAHPFLYTPFDAAIGHYRRYTAPSLRAAAPSSLRLRRLEYLDSAGLLASLANRLWLRSATPTEAQIRLWDTLLVPCSMLIDRLTWGRLGKSVLGIWTK